MNRTLLININDIWMSAPILCRIYHLLSVHKYTYTNVLHIYTKCLFTNTYTNVLLIQIGGKYILDVLGDCMQDLSSGQAEESPCLTLLLPPIFAATYDLTYPDHHNNVLVKIPQALNCEYPPCRGKQK